MCNVCIFNLIKDHKLYSEDPFGLYLYIPLYIIFKQVKRKSNEDDKKWFLKKEIRNKNKITDLA